MRQLLHISLRKLRWNRTFVRDPIAPTLLRLYIYDLQPKRKENDPTYSLTYYLLNIS